MSKIQAKTKSVRELLSNVKYGIDFYQRGYAWERRHIEELLDDFEGRFIASYSEQHERMQVQHYPHYFLGTIITVKESGQTYIVDGQQRLTTLTLLLIYIYHLRNNNGEVADVKPLIFSASYGTKSFNIHVPERIDCMQALFERNEFDATDHPDLSVRNLAERYGDIQELFPDSLTGDTLPYFVDWLIENVDLVEIEAYTDDDAFTIFETMNDRGLSLGQADMLKGYLLANINGFDEKVVHQQKTQANNVWKKRIVELIDIKAGEDEDFFKIWLRAKYAVTIRERKKGAKDLDYENINKFHRWVRDNKTRIGLDTTQDFHDLIMQQFNRFAGHYIAMRQASLNLTDGREEIYYNAYNNFTLQYMLALSPLKLSDDSSTVDEKIRLVTTFLDIYLARRIVNYKTNTYSASQYTMFNLMKAIRDLDVAQLRRRLYSYLNDMDETFDAIGQYYLHRRNYTRTRYLLARITAWIEQGSGKNDDFDFYTSWSSKKPFQIEHIWAYKYERHLDEFDNEYEFQRYRDRFGGLVLLPRGTNQSFGAAVYEDKVQHYVKDNLLAASLHPQAYEKNPNFTNFVNRSGLPFRAHEQFKRADMDARQDLYRQICEKIWNPDRLG